VCTYTTICPVGFTVLFLPASIVALYPPPDWVEFRKKEKARCVTQTKNVVVENANARYDKHTKPQKSFHRKYMFTSSTSEGV
jgi:hypothetical protein